LQDCPSNPGTEGGEREREREREREGGGGEGGEGGRERRVRVWNRTNSAAYKMWKRISGEMVGCTKHIEKVALQSNNYSPFKYKLLTKLG